VDVPLVNGDTGLVTGLTLFIELPVGGGIVPSYTLRTARLFRLSLRSHPPPRSHTHTRARAGSLVATTSVRFARLWVRAQVRGNSREGARSDRGVAAGPCGVVGARRGGEGCSRWRVRWLRMLVACGVAIGVCKAVRNSNARPALRCKHSAAQHSTCRVHWETGKHQVYLSMAASAWAYLSDPWHPLDWATVGLLLTEYKSASASRA
jgi:hypothetical protein